jgi:hypothetical protein
VTAGNEALDKSDAADLGLTGESGGMAMRLTNLIVLGLTALPVSAQDTVQWGSTGNWQIWIDPTMGNGCFAYVSYQDGSFFRSGFDMTDDSAYVFFSDPDWQSLVPGDTYDLRVYFDPLGSYWDASALAQKFDDGTLFLRFNTSDAKLLEDIMKADVARVDYNGREIANYTLMGSHQALLGVVECQDEADKVMGNTDPFAGKPVSDDPFTGEKNATDPFAQ